MNHFVTLFNYNYLPQGLAMINSLKSDKKHTIWVVCLDDELFNFLSQNKIENVELISLDEIQKFVGHNHKKNRSFLEYCWLLTPFSIKYVLTKAQNANEVTYIDADVFFFKKIDPLIDEFKNSGKDIYIQLHDYEDNNINFSKSGKFIIQFLTFKNNQKAEKIRNEWEIKCVQSTSIDYKNNIVGDQKYFDELYSQYTENFCVSKNFSFFQAPWTSDKSKIANVILYHFHSLRVCKTKVKMFSGYKLDDEIIKNVYIPYLKELKLIMKNNNLKIDQTLSGEKESFFTKFRAMINRKLFKIFTKRNLDVYKNLDEIK